MMNLGKDVVLFKGRILFSAGVVRSLVRSIVFLPSL